MWSLVQYRRIRKQVEREWQEKVQEQDHTQKTSVFRDVEASSERGILKRDNGIIEEDSSGERTESEGGSPSGNDKIVVDLAGDNDPIDPHNWPLSSRCKNIAVLCLLIFSQGWASAADSMANSRISQDYGVSKVTANLSQALYLLGIGSGCLFCGPLSETIGRNPTYLGATVCYLCFVLGTALTSNLGGRIVCRYFVGVFASATLGINGASVSDQFRPVKRAFAFPVIAWANVAAPMLAPVVGGWLVQDRGRDWHWVDWVTLIISGFAFIIAFLFLPETYLPVLLDWKATHLRRVSGSSRYVSEHAEKASFLKRLREVLPMPVVYFSSEPVVAVLGGYLILVYVLMFSFLSGFDYIFKKTYGLSDGLTGSCFASIAAGSTFFTLSAPVLFRLSRIHTDFVRQAWIKPEYRLWPAIVTAPLMPISLFWLGWTNYPSISLWSGLAACFCFGIVATAVYVSSYEYIVDSYTKHSAVALASITMARYLVAGTMVMAARPMYTGIGVHWTMTLLGCIGVLLAPAPLFFRLYGKRLRAKSVYAES
ncbi:uncharacterized protein Z520_00024 [Fonsecaea multimorphosa CBS 102226]|uniref:Major facilitator superfamily (MFS) profile domain-containing protein n=1 Tax=Fonsecaea multimorphosa CBS 102226 TaxID=1442371 RepID=A0A0D2KBB9_9EURO|nr:uncharacterized protein Z520_00024 [Fonsecaea multimorphosa CBS 102226]KIY03333.1 hypothetical protein Z520_00024 [Fonsecaea multimorphosa CBS 102226]OAL32984.1 hypothetical protein AYO22_00069 [Fonsecaea multimorphosa]